MDNISLKLREKESVLRFKNGSPRLKDVLRKKCKERLQKNRNDFIDRLRNLDADIDVTNELTNVIKEDLKTIYTSVNNNNNLDSNQTSDETINNKDLEWLMSKYDSIFCNEEYLMEMYDSLNEVICPICQKNVLKKFIQNRGFVITCAQCQFSINTNNELLQIKEDLMLYLDQHNNDCSIDPQFNILTEFGESHIYMLCYSCSCFVMVL